MRSAVKNDGVVAGAWRPATFQGGSATGGMDDAVREKLLRRVNRQGATVGASLPETVTVDGEELPLAEFVVETRKVPGVPPESRELLANAKRTLRGERARRLERLESEPIDRETAETLADEIIGIDRALNSLENIRQPDYGESSRAAAIDDHKRWLGFLDTLS